MLRRAFRKGFRMTAVRAEASLKSCASHRTYQDQDGTDTAFCWLVGREDELLRLAAGINRIELRQAPGTGWIPAIMTDSLVEAIRSIGLVADSADPRAERMEREMRRRITDLLARIRIRCNRRLLAGVTRISNEDEDQTVLVLIFARKDIRSCEWKLAA
jgi:hypothetical protein